MTADAAGEELTHCLLLQPSPGYDLLFGRPQNGTTFGTTSGG
ncbi:hypothetical protein [Streptomyces sp. NPDC017230]